MRCDGLVKLIKKTRTSVRKPEVLSLKHDWSVAQHREQKRRGGEREKSSLRMGYGSGLQNKGRGGNLGQINKLPEGDKEGNKTRKEKTVGYPAGRIEMGNNSPEGQLCQGQSLLLKKAQKNRKGLTRIQMG